MPSLSLPAAFRLGQYQLAVETLEPLHISPNKGSALRGGFGHTFKRLACTEPWPCGDRCQRGNACPYGYVFETSPPDDSEVLRNLGEVPRPFIIQPPLDQRTLIPAGEQLIFGLTLIGRALDYLPYFVAVFRELGNVGLGPKRGRYRLVRVDAILASSWQAQPGPTKGAGQRSPSQPVYRPDEDVVYPADATITADSIMSHAATLPAADRLTLEFLTPTRLKHGGRWTREGPPFHVLVKTLLARVSSLSYFHCGQQVEADFRGLIDQAAGGVRIAHCRTGWQDWSRFSSRQEQRVEMGGLVGRVTYEPAPAARRGPGGELRPYLPLLAAGELVHVGKGTVFGNGKYVISQT